MVLETCVQRSRLTQKVTHMFWYLVEQSLSLSNRPLVLADLTIWTRIGVSSPSKARRPLAKAAAVIYKGRAMTGSSIYSRSSEYIPALDLRQRHKS